MTKVIRVMKNKYPGNEYGGIIPKLLKVVYSRRKCTKMSIAGGSVPKLPLITKVIKALKNKYLGNEYGGIIPKLLKVVYSRRKCTKVSTKTTSDYQGDQGDEK